MTTNTEQPRDAVVVGVDGSPAGDRALAFAVEQAARSHRPLHLVHATGVGIVPWTEERLQRQREITEERRQRAVELDDEVAVTAATVVGEAAASLVEASRTASLVVLDAGGLGTAMGVLMGATTHQVAAHAHCPVMVTPHTDEPSRSGPVVVGIDADERSAAAIEWAFAEASARDAELVAVHTWWWEDPNPFFGGVDREEIWQEVAESQRLLVAEMLAGWQEKYPDVVLIPSLVRGQAATVLEDVSGSSQLVVVGSRGRGGFAGLLLGSVGLHALHHTRCPLVVVHSAGHGDR